MKGLLVGLFILISMFFVTVAQESGEGVTIQTANHETLGTPYLVDAEGMSLYLFLNDAENVSNCYDQCAENWPPLLVEGEPTAGEGVDPELLGTTEREDGQLQVTYNGWPLYYFARDENPGDTNGQAVGDVWYLVSEIGGQVGVEVQQDPPPADQEEDTPGDGSEDESGEGESNGMGSVHDGVYTAEQAEEGSGLYARHCESCHGDNLTGGIGGGPPIAGSFFFNRWSGRSLHELFEYTSTAMPLDHPGSLSDDVYADILAYVLAFNEFPAGESELSSNPDQLQNIVIEQNP